MINSFKISYAYNKFVDLFLFLSSACPAMWEISPSFCCSVSNSDSSLLLVPFESVVSAWSGPCSSPRLLCANSYFWVVNKSCSTTVSKLFQLCSNSCNSERSWFPPKWPQLTVFCSSVAVLVPHSFVQVVRPIMKVSTEVNTWDTTGIWTL